MNRSRTNRVVASLAAVLALAATAKASSHREAPGITRMPQVDATDFYMFRSYETGREDFVTLIANYNPLQDPYGGPNYFALDRDARYRIHIDNTGDARPNLTWEFRVDVDLVDVRLPVGGAMVSIPLSNIAPGEQGLNIRRSARLSLVRNGSRVAVTDAASGSASLAVPFDNIGRKSFGDYQNYAADFIHEVEIPGCGSGRVFVGQRRESFAVNLGELFDLVNINPIGSPRGEADDLEDKNVTSFIIEVPTECLTQGNTDVIGGWTTAHLPKNRRLRRNPSFDRPDDQRGSLVQVSRLGMPLVNEVVIGLPDKNRFNASKPENDLQFAAYVTNPTLPEILEVLFPVEAPNNFPRQDLLATFVTGIAGLNQFGFGEMQRLNVSIAPTSRAAQKRLGVIAGDNAGFPNGRRPGDDVVDIELRVAMGLLCHAFPGAFCDPADAPSGTLPYTDGAIQRANQFDGVFPYLRTPIPGSPN